MKLLNTFLLLIISALIGGIIGVAIVKATTYTYPYYSDVQAQNGIFTYGCIPRPGVSGGDWFILNNATHEPENCTGITTYSDKIQVNINNCYDEVITASVTVDEIFAKNGITPGLMMGLCEWTIFLYDREGNLIDPGDLTSSGDWAGANLWVISRGED